MRDSESKRERDVSGGVAPLHIKPHRRPIHGSDCWPLPNCKGLVKKCDWFDA